MPYPDRGSGCPIAGCKRVRAMGMLMCATCWHRVPADIQGEVYAAWKRRRDASTHETRQAAEVRHEAAKKAAIEAVERRG